MESSPSFEDAAIRDTFDDLHRKIYFLMADKKYAEAREEVKRELRLLADALGGPINEQMAKLNREFEAFLPEDMRTVLKTETSEEEEEVANTESEDELIARMAEEGWKLVKTITGKYEAGAEDMPKSGKEMFVASQGTTKLIFERDKR